VTCHPAGDGWTCQVRVTESDGSSEHRVDVARDDLTRLAPGAATPEDLVRRSFHFLLAREPRTSILARFDLRLIGRYFPEYEATIRR
jgi:hypothetical protein